MFLQRLEIVLQHRIVYWGILVCSLIYALFVVIYVDKKSVYSSLDQEFNLVIKKIRYKDDQTIIYFDGKEKLISYYEGVFPYHLGDRLIIKGTLEEAKNNTIPNLFNYKKYLYYNDMFYILEIKELSLVENDKNFLYKFKNKIIERIEKILLSKEYLYAFILGDNYYLKQEVKDAYQFLGVSHLFSIGSLNILFLSVFVSYLFRKLKIKDHWYLLFIILVFIIYFFLTDYAISVVRSGISFVILYINKKLKLKIKYLDILLLIGSVCLFYNPYYLFNIGFQYSYVVSFFLSIYKDLIKGNYFKRTLLISLIAFFVSLPITIFYNYEINFLAIIFNLLYVPLINFIIFPLTIVVLLFPKLCFILNTLVNVIESLTLYLAEIKIFSVVLSKPNCFLMITYYFLIIYIFSSLKRGKRNSFWFLIILICFHHNINFFKNDNYMLFFDVNQGDAILFKTNNKVFLIDTGGSYYNDHSDDIVKYLKSCGISKIDYILITHGDFDHMGEAIDLVNKMKVEKVVFNNGEYNSLELDLIKLLERKEIAYYQNIKKLKIDNNILYFLNNFIYDNENDNSNVIYTELNDYKFLLMGDAGIQVEDDLVKKYKLSDIDVLKAGHHGSKTSSSKKFINNINPKYSIISVGKNNRYGHPNNEVLDNLKNSIIYRTDQDGSIMFTIKNNKLEIETFPP